MTTVASYTLRRSHTHKYIHTNALQQFLLAFQMHSNFFSSQMPNCIFKLDNCFFVFFLTLLIVQCSCSKFVLFKSKWGLNIWLLPFCRFRFKDKWLFSNKSSEWLQVTIHTHWQPDTPLFICVGLNEFRYYFIFSKTAEMTNVGSHRVGARQVNDSISTMTPRSVQTGLSSHYFPSFKVSV